MSGCRQGNRNQLAPYMRRAFQAFHFVCISADYRLAPQARIEEILEDVKDCVAFIRNELTSYLESGLVDVSRLAISGSSAGGYLALLAGLYLDPKPQVVMPIYPISDPHGTFFVNSQPAPMQRYLASREELAEYLDPKAERVANCGPLPDDKRMHMYVRMMADANLAKLLGIPDVDSAAPYRISPNVHKHRLPPAYFLHGDADSCVGVEQADEVVGTMLGCGLEVQYERVHGKDHFMDTGVDYENEAMFRFMMAHV